MAALVSSGGTYAAVRINGRSIAPHSIPLNRLAHAPLAHLAFTRIASEETVIEPQVYGYAKAQCPDGEQAIAGGFNLTAQLNDAQVIQLGSWPFADLTSWGTFLENAGTTPATVQAYAVCVS